MRAIFGKTFPLVASGLLFCAFTATVYAHPVLNGTWSLQPTRSDFAGEPALQTGTVTISERQHNIYISRSFNYDNEKGGFDYNFTTDGRENSTIKNGTAFRSKARWEGGTLVVRTTRDGMTTTERYNLSADGMLMLTVERPSHHAETLLFQRQ